MKNYGLVLCVCVSLALASCEFLFAPSRHTGEGSVGFNLGTEAGGARALSGTPGFPLIDRAEVTFYTAPGGEPVQSRVLAGEGPYLVPLPAGTYTAKIVARPLAGHGHYSFSSTLAGTSEEFTITAGATTNIDPIHMRPSEPAMFRFSVNEFVDQNADPAETLTIYHAAGSPSAPGHPALDLRFSAHSFDNHPYFDFDPYGRLIMLGYFPDTADPGYSHKLKIFEDFSGSVLTLNTSSSYLAYDSSTNTLFFLNSSIGSLSYMSYETVCNLEDGASIGGAPLFSSGEVMMVSVADGYLYTLDDSNFIHKYKINDSVGSLWDREVDSSMFSSTQVLPGQSPSIRDFKVIKGKVIVLLRDNNQGAVYIYNAETGVYISHTTGAMDDNGSTQLVNPTRILGADATGVWIFDYLDAATPVTDLSRAKNLHVGIDW